MYLMGVPMYWYFDSPNTSPSLRRHGGNGNNHREKVGQRPVAVDEHKQMTPNRGETGNYSGAGCGNRSRQQGLHIPAEQLHINVQNSSPHVNAGVFSGQRSSFKSRVPNGSEPVRKTPQKFASSKRGHRTTAATKQNGVQWSGNRYECTSEQLLSRERKLNHTKKFNFNNTIPGCIDVQVESGHRAFPKVVPFCDSYPQIPFYPLPTWPIDPEACVISSAQESSAQAAVSEPTSPVLSDKDCSFMTYSSDGISVIISNGSSDYQHGMPASGAYAPDKALEQLERKMSSEMSFKDDNKSVKPPSIYTPSGSCQDLQFSGSPPLPDSTCSQSHVDSLSPTSGQSSLFCDDSPPAAVSDNMPGATTSSPVTMYTSTSPPLHGKSNISSMNSPTNNEDSWMWFPAILPTLTLLLRWVWFPAPPPNLPWKDPQLAPDEKPVDTAHYYLRGHPPDLSNIQYIKGNWTKEQSCWKWTPPNSTDEGAGVQHCYELPTPPKPAPGAWYLVWPAELPISSSPFIPGRGTWLPGPALCKNDPNSVPFSSKPVNLYY